MRNLLKILITVFLFLSMGVFAQEPGDSRPLADNTTFKGRREMKREKKVKRSERKNAKQQERTSIKKRDFGKKIVIGPRKKRNKGKNKEKKTKIVEPENDQTN
jgi:hypothetical protein